MRFLPEGWQSALVSRHAGMEKHVQQARGEGSKRAHLALLLSLLVCTLALTSMMLRRDQRACRCNVAVHVTKRGERGSNNSIEQDPLQAEGMQDDAGGFPGAPDHSEGSPATPSPGRTAQRNGGGAPNQGSPGAPSTGSTAPGGAAGAGPKHIYVVGCGHSGTSVLKRTITNLPGLLCVPKETNTYIDHSNNTAEVQKRVGDWDAQATNASFSGWVEKSPGHVRHLADIFRLDPSARVVFIVRDGRDVASSLVTRGWAFEQGLSRWVEDNTAALPYLNSSQVLTVKFEDFSSKASVLRVLRQLSNFVGAPAGPPRLLLALQPPSQPLPEQHQCAAFGSEQQKVADLTASYLQSLEELAGSSGMASKGPAPDRLNHDSFRSWQVSQAWAPHGPQWEKRLTQEQRQVAEGHAAFQKLLARFGYA